MKTSTTTKTEVAPFELKLPDIFNVQPAHTVELPAGFKALIFDTSVHVKTSPGGAAEYQAGWKVVLVNRKGFIGDDYHCDHRYRTIETTSPLEISLLLKDWAKALSKTKRTNTRVDEPEID